MDMTFSRHALEQMPCRNLSRADIAVVAEWGVRVRRTGVTFVFLGRRQLAQMPDGGRKHARLEGTLLLLDDGHVITCYRNRQHGLRDARKKAPYERTTAPAPIAPTETPSRPMV